MAVCGEQGGINRWTQIVRVMRKITAHFFISKFSSKYIGFLAKKTCALLAELFFTCKSTVCMMTWPGGEFSAIAYHFVCWLFTPSCARINLAAMMCQHKPGLPPNFINLHSVQMLNTSSPRITTIVSTQLRASHALRYHTMQ